MSRSTCEGADSGVPLGLFRILFGVCLGLDVAGLIRDAPFWFDHVPFDGSRAPWVRAGLAVWLVAVGCLTVGYRTRIAAVCSYVSAVLFLGFGGMRFGYEYHPDGLYILLSLGMLWMPVSARLSVDSRTSGRRTVGPGASIFLALVAASIYLDSAIWKLSSELWVNGLGYWLPAVQPTDALVSMPWTYETRWLAVLLSHITLAYELLFPVLVWWRRARVVLIAVGTGLHVGVATVIPLPLFGLLMVAVLVGIWPARGSRRPVLASPVLANSVLANSVLPNAVRTRHWWAAALIAAGAFLLCVAEPIAVLRSRGLGARRGDEQVAAWPPRLGSAVERTRQRALVWSYRLLGIRSHPMFLDSAFADYTVDRRLVYIPSEAGSASAERFYPPNRNRHYVHWHYRTVWPLLDQSLRDTKLRRFVRFHAARGGLDLRKGRVLLQKRHVHLPTGGWVAGQREKNLAEPWVDETAIDLRLRE